VGTTGRTALTCGMAQARERLLAQQLEGARKALLLLQQVSLTWNPKPETLPPQTTCSLDWTVQSL